MKQITFFLWSKNVLLILLLSFMIVSCKCRCRPYMKMNPPADSDKPMPVPSGDNSCWMHTASNMLAGAGYGIGTTVQNRADNIFKQMSNHYGTSNGGWIDAALQWWLGSSHNTWSTNPYTVVIVQGNKRPPNPWSNQNAPRDIGNYLRTCDMVGVSTSIPTGAGGTAGHAITSWGDNICNTGTLTSNPAKIRVTDSDNETGGDVQIYTYDSYTNPNPGGPNEGNGWYLNYGNQHRYIKHIVTLSRTTSGSNENGVIARGSYQIHQKLKNSATDLHYRVGTDVNILTYRTWVNWDGTPNIKEARPRRSITVDWDLSKKPIPYCNWITINTEFVESSWNSIKYHDVHFTYPDINDIILPDLSWKIETPILPKSESIPNVTGGYIIGSFDVYDPKSPDEPIVRYRLVHQYLYNQSPEFHTFLLDGTLGFEIKNLKFTHSYGYPTNDELWQLGKWMTVVKDSVRILSDRPMKIQIDWKGQLPYPKGDG